MLEEGPSFFARVIAQMTDWMQKKGYTSRRSNARIDESAVGESFDRVRARQLH